MQEEWRPIKGYEGLYEVSNTGRIKSHLELCRVKNKLLKGFKMEKGYIRVSLSKNKIFKTYSIHRLVAIVFIPNIENKPDINHIDNNPSNNNINNLEWVTNEENKRHSVKQGRHAHRETHSRAKLTGKDIVEIRKSRLSNRDLSNKYNIDLSIISKIKNNKIWKHIN